MWNWEWNDDENHSTELKWVLLQRDVYAKKSVDHAGLTKRLIYFHYNTTLGYITSA
jgi:hypothetical protein